ncbi:hypothetical protein [Lysinibacillus capsici]|uniref:hypothetical protein n=1 Tax=Lysinibacillus capsici TaxID=2115968 RepID=UPI0034E1E925
MIANTHNASMKLERICRAALNYDDRGALYGIVAAGYIDEIGNAFHVIAIALAPYFKDGDDDIRKRIDSFLGSYYHLSDTKYDKEKYGEEVYKAAKALDEFIHEISN